MSQIALSSELQTAADTVDDLIASLQITSGLRGAQLPVDHEGLLEFVVTLSEDQQRKLVQFSLYRAVDFGLMMHLAAVGFPMDLYFAAVERGAHPALPTTEFQLEFVPTLAQQPGLLEAALSKPEMLRALLVQTGFVQRLHGDLLSFVAEEPVEQQPTP